MVKIGTPHVKVEFKQPTIKSAIAKIVDGVLELNWCLLTKHLYNMIQIFKKMGE